MCRCCQIIGHTCGNFSVIDTTVENRRLIESFVGSTFRGIERPVKIKTFFAKDKNEIPNIG